MKNFELNNKNLTLLQNKGKIYTYLSSKLDKAYFKLSNGKFVFALCSSDGLLTTTLDVDYKGDTEYFSAEWSKWSIALQKFAGADVLKLSLNKNLLKICVEGSCNVVTLSVVNYEDDSMMAKQIDEFIPTRKNEIIGYNHKLELTPEIISNFDLMNNLFTTQNRVNSIGLSQNDVMYADRSVVVKANLNEPLSNDLFTGIDPEDNHIYLHTFTLKLLDFLKDFNTTIYFDNDYEVLYWADSDSELVVYSDAKNVNLPTQEQFEGIQPENKEVFVDIPVNTKSETEKGLKEGLEFFTGLYDGSSWKPIKFILKKGEDVLLYYKNPLTEAKFNIEGTKSNYDGEFVLESETLRKILQKVNERFADNDLSVRFTFDPAGVEDGAPGVYCTAGNTYEFIISKLLDE